MLKAADTKKSGVMTVEDIKKLLRNIGAEGSLTNEELDIIMNEAGATGQAKVLPIEKMMKLL